MGTIFSKLFDTFILKVTFSPIRNNFICAYKHCLELYDTVEVIYSIGGI